MMFFGSMMCADIMSVPCTPTDIDNITKIEISNAWYDDLRVTKNVEEELSSEVNQEWDWDTILHAKFDSSVGAGNVLWDLSKVSHLLVKRKKINDFKWTTIKVQEVVTKEDFNLRDIDITATPNYEYQYAAVPIIDGIEGFYSIDVVEVKTNSILIADRTAIWNTNLTDNYFNNTSVVPNSVVETMYGTYPTIIRNTNANYETIEVSAQFIPVDDETGCTLLIEDDKRRIEYNKSAKMFLRNGHGKILKSMSGDIWGIYVTTPPTDTATDDYRNRKISFACTEIFDVEDEGALYDCGIIDVPHQWHNR